MADIEKRVKSGSRIGSGFPPIEQFLLGRPGQPGYFEIRSGNDPTDRVIISGVEDLWRLGIGRERAELAPFRVSKSGKVIATSLVLENYKDCEDSSVTYTGTWIYSKQGTFMGSKGRRTSVAGSKFTISYFGPDIVLFMDRNVDQGLVQVTLDDAVLGSADLYTPYYEVRGAAIQVLNKTNTAHVLEIELLPTYGGYARFQGYSLFPNAGINLEQLDCDLIAYTTSRTLNANGYLKFDAASLVDQYGNPTHSTYCIVGVMLSEAVMSDATLTDPKIAWRTEEVYLYNGAPGATYSVTVTLMVSKLG